MGQVFSLSEMDTMPSQLSPACRELASQHFLEQTLFFRLLASYAPLTLFVPAESPDQSSVSATWWLRSNDVGWV